MHLVTMNVVCVYALLYDKSVLVKTQTKTTYKWDENSFRKLVLRVYGLKDYRNGISSTDSSHINDVNLIDYTTNETHQSKIESPTPTSPSSSLFVRNKNPFLIGDMKHSDEFTQSPMKICLVVSPPTSKLLQVCSN